MTRRISLVAVCCSSASVKSRLNSLISRRSLALATFSEGLRVFDGGRLVVDILYLCAWPNPKSEYRKRPRRSKQNGTKINPKCGKSKTRNPNEVCLEHCICFSHLNLFRISKFVIEFSPRCCRSLARLTPYPSPGMNRQRERKSTAFPHFTVQPDLSPMQLDKLLGQG